MSDKTPKSGVSRDSLLAKSFFYRECVAELEEIRRLKWLESEKAGHDIGHNAALIDWVCKHRAAWRAKRWKLSHDGCCEEPRPDYTERP